MKYIVSPEIYAALNQAGLVETSKGYDEAAGTRIVALKGGTGIWLTGSLRQMIQFVLENE